MKTKYMTAIAAMGLTLAAGLPCIAGPTVAEVTPRPVLITTAPVAEVPTVYVWDGSEYVGQVGANYYYLGPNKTWVKFDKPRQDRFDDWQKKNPGWRSHQIQNTRYRAHDMGQSHPAKVPNPPPQENPHSH